MYFSRQNESALVGLSFLIGFSMGPGWGTTVAIAVDHFPNRSGVVASAVAALGAFGSVFNQPIFGFIGEQFGLSIAVLYAGFLLLVFVVILQASKKLI